MTQSACKCIEFLQKPLGPWNNCLISESYELRSSHTLTQVVRIFSSYFLCTEVSHAFSEAIKSVLLLQSVTIWPNLFKQTKTNGVSIYSACSKMCINVTFKSWISDKLASLNVDTGWALENKGDKEREMASWHFSDSRTKCVFRILQSQARVFKPDDGLVVINRDVQSSWPFTLLLVLYLEKVPMT